MKSKNRIIELLQIIKENKINYPSTWSDYRKVDENIQFRTYLNDDRDYFSFQFDTNKKGMTFIINEKYSEITINGTLSKLNTLKDVIFALETITNFKFNNAEDIVKLKREIKSKRETKKRLDKEIKDIKNLITQ